VPFYHPCRVAPLAALLIFLSASARAQSTVHAPASSSAESVITHDAEGHVVIRATRITEPMRIDGMAGYETRIDATSGKDNTAVTVVQWLRFGGPNALRIIGSAPRDQWAKAFPRFRAVRDGIQPRG